MRSAFDVFILYLVPPMAAVAASSPRQQRPVVMVWKIVVMNQWLPRNNLCGVMQQRTLADRLKH